MTNHDAFTYFVDAYDVTFVGSIIPSFDDNAEPSAAEIDELVAKIRDTGVQAVFSEASISPKAAETIAAESGATVYSGDDALYGDSLGQPRAPPGETYLGSQVHNATLILESWGVTPSPLPPPCKDDAMTDSPVLRLAGAAFTHPGGAGCRGLELEIRARRGGRAHRPERRGQVHAAQGRARAGAAHRRMTSVEHRCRASTADADAPAHMPATA